MCGKPLVCIGVHITEVAVPWLLLLRRCLHIPMASQTCHSGVTTLCTYARMHARSGVCCVHDHGDLGLDHGTLWSRLHVCTEYTVWNLVFAMTKTCQSLGSHTQYR